MAHKVFAVTFLFRIIELVPVILYVLSFSTHVHVHSNFSALEGIGHRTGLRVFPGAWRKHDTGRDSPTFWEHTCNPNISLVLLNPPSRRWRLGGRFWMELFYLTMLCLFDVVSLNEIFGNQRIKKNLNSRFFGFPRLRQKCLVVSFGAYR